MPRRRPDSLPCAKDGQSLRCPMLLKVKDAAKRLTVSQSFLYGEIADRRITFVRLGKGQGGLRIPEAAIEDYLRVRTVGVATERQEEAPSLPVPSGGKRLDLW